MNKYGLTKLKIKSDVRPLGILQEDNLKQTIQDNFPSSGYAVVWLYNEVKILKYNSIKDLYFDPKYLQKLRLFNQTSELHIWRSRGELKGRLRIDEKGDDCLAIEADQVLWGTDFERDKNGNKISDKIIVEKRGTRIELPFNGFQVDEKNRIAIRTRNYVGYNDIGQAGYVDSMFVCFVKMPERKCIGE